MPDVPFRVSYGLLELLRSAVWISKSNACWKACGFHPYQRPAYLLLVIDFPIQLFLFCVDDYVCGCISYDIQGDDGHSRRVVHG